MKFLLPISILMCLLSLQQPSFAAFPIQTKQLPVSITQENGNNTNFPNQIPEKKHKKDNATTAMVLGIVGIVFMPYGIVCSILAIVFGSQSIHGPRRGQAQAGLILGIVGAAIFLLSLALFFIIISSFKIY